MVSLDVKGMTCGGCAVTVEKLIKREDAAAQVKVDLATGQVTAQTTAPADRLVAAISAAGFEAKAA